MIAIGVRTLSLWRASCGRAGSGISPAPCHAGGTALLENGADTNSNPLRKPEPAAATLIANFPPLELRRAGRSAWFPGLVSGLATGGAASGDPGAGANGGSLTSRAGAPVIEPRRTVVSHLYSCSVTLRPLGSPAHAASRLDFLPSAAFLQINTVESFEPPSLGAG